MWSPNAWKVGAGRHGRAEAGRRTRARGGRMGLMEHHNLIAGPPATYLPEDTEATAELAAGDDPSAVAARYPTFLAAWAALADQAMDRGDAVTSYAFARTGYHRGLDQLRRAG